MVGTGLDEPEKPARQPLTLASRQTLCRSAGLETAAAALLEKHAFLEDGLAALADHGHFDAAYRLVARMLPPSGAILWVVMCQDHLGRGEGDPAAREALIAYAKNPGPESRVRAEEAGRALGGTLPLGLAARALSWVSGVANGTDQADPGGMFPDLVGRAVWLTSLARNQSEHEKTVFAKDLVALGVGLALAPTAS